ncbi:MAG: DUF4340 domain-containing protein [Chitinophagia bacterium]|nr:DUF4340 domain-containing protein [Chitinophagia bacterium]
MKKTLVYLLILLALGAGLYYFVFNNKLTNPFGKSEAGFNIADTGAIGKMYLVTNTGESVLLERKQGMWMLDGKYKALPSMVNMFLGTLAGQEALYPVPENEKKTSIYTLATQNVKVEIYDRQGKKMAVFYVGGASVKGVGTDMLMEGAEKPYVVVIPAFNGSLRPRYSVQWKDWRDRTVFDVAPDKIKSISVKYADEPLNSYTITHENGKVFKVNGAPEVTEHLGELNTTRTELYFTSFTNVNCEGYLNGAYDMDSIIKAAQPMSVVEVASTDGKSQVAEIYWMPINKRSKNQLVADKEVADKYDADRMYAVINDRHDTVMIQTQAFRRIFRRSYEFFEHSGPAPKAH